MIRFSSKAASILFSRKKLLLFVLTAVLCACSSTPGKSISPAESMPDVEKQWGIQIEGIRLTAAEYMLDFRYKVLDPEKALPILDHKIKPYLIDQATGAKVEVASHYKVGTMRPTDRSGKPKAGKIYFAIFANPGRFIKAGSKVTLVIGDFRVEDLVVE